MLEQIIEENKMLKAHILATVLPISSKICGIAMCVPCAWFREAYLLFKLELWLTQVLEMKECQVNLTGGSAHAPKYSWILALQFSVGKNCI
jgi:hypothetical protein